MNLEFLTSNEMTNVKGGASRKVLRSRSRKSDEPLKDKDIILDEETPL